MSLSLCKLQQQILQAIRSPEHSVDGCLEQKTRTTGRLDIYRNNYRGTHRKILRSVYPCIASQVGDACFYTFCRDYIATNPSSTYSLDHYGGNFAELLAQLVQQRPELARMRQGSRC